METAKAFGKAIVYELMSHGEHYFTAQQMEKVADTVADMLPSDVTTEDLKTFRDDVSQAMLGIEIPNPGSAQIYGFLVGAGMFAAIPLPDWIEQSIDDFTELADRFYRMAGIEP